MYRGQDEVWPVEASVEGPGDGIDWHQEASPQWTEILSPYPDIGSFMQQFSDPFVNYTGFEWSGDDSQPTETASGSPTPSFNSTSTSRRTFADRGQDSNRGRGLTRELLSGGTSLAVSDLNSRRSFQPSVEDSRSHAQSPLSRHKVPIPPADRLPERPKRKIKAPQICGLEDCGKVFACAYDFNRHLRDVHALGYWIYKCDKPACGYVRPRKDKVREHCTKRKHPGPIAVYVGDGQNAGELATMIEQRRKKERRRSTCRKCGKHDGDES